MKPITYFLAALMATSCGQERVAENSDGLSDTDSIELPALKTGSVTAAGTISSACAIIIAPNDAKIDSLRKINGEEGFEVVLDDNQYYLGTAREYLDSVNLQTIDTVSTGALKFKLASGEIVTIELADYSWDILLFNGRTKPIAASLTEFKPEFDQYMSQK